MHAPSMPMDASIRYRYGLIALGIGAVFLAASTSARAQADGGAIYTQQNCFACHGGLGGGGLGPQLAGDPLLAIDKFVVAQILIGRGEMPSFGGKLSDEQIAAVAGYIRNSWGNNFGPVSPQTVAETRRTMTQALQAAQAQRIPGRPLSPQRPTSP